MLITKPAFYNGILFSSRKGHIEQRGLVARAHTCRFHGDIFATQMRYISGRAIIASYGGCSLRSRLSRLREIRFDARPYICDMINPCFRKLFRRRRRKIGTGDAVFSYGEVVPVAPSKVYGKIFKAGQ